MDSFTAEHRKLIEGMIVDNSQRKLLPMRRDAIRALRDSHAALETESMALFVSRNALQQERDAGDADYARLEKYHAEVTAERDALAERVRLMEPAQSFAGKILDMYCENWATDFDGGTLEDWADECGLMLWIDMSADSGEHERCTNCEGDCDRCHRYTAAASAARIAALGPGKV